MNEAYNTLKYSHKRKDYDRKLKIHKMRDSNEYKAYAQKMKMQGQTDFNEEMFHNMKKT